MPIYYVVALGVVLASIGLAWGLIMLSSPPFFARLTSVDWMADIVADFARRAPWEIRLVGVLLTGLSGYVLMVLVQALLR